jgi:hypothetical protein
LGLQHRDGKSRRKVQQVSVINSTSAATVKPMAAYQISIQRMVCTGCGAEANAACNCGLDYKPKSVRAREAVEANPEKSDRAIAADIGVTAPTVGKARKESTVNNFTVDERTGLDGKTRKLPERKPAKLEAEDEPKDEDDRVSPEYVRVVAHCYKLEDRNRTLTAALNAKEATASRNWPADMTSKQIKHRDKCLMNIAAWQRDLEQLYGEVTGQPSWRVEVTTKEGARLGTGARFGTRGEAEFYNTHFAARQVEHYATGEIIPCGKEKANVLIDGDSIRFNHGDCVLLNWQPASEAAE